MNLQSDMEVYARLGASDRLWLQLHYTDWAVGERIDPHKNYSRVYEWMRDAVKRPDVPAGALGYLRSALANRAAEKMRGY